MRREKEAMANTDDKPVMKITMDDLAKVAVPDSQSASAATAGGQRQYGNIAEPAGSAAAVVEEKGSILLKGWFYPGAAGLVGALLGWGICEPWFLDSLEGSRWGNVFMMPFVIMLMCVGLGVAESLVERALSKIWWRALLALVLGFVLGFVFDFIAEMVFGIARGICYELGVRTNTNPAAWIARGVAWMVFGVAGGIVYGIVDRSGKKVRYGILGGIIGAGLGGTIFDPIALVTHAGGPSRAAGFGLLGLATGVAMGIVESALKDRWLYVASGPLAGKQFILYKPLTTLGTSQQCHIYLFKDNSTLPQHGSIEVRGAQTFLRASGQVYVSGQPVRSRALQSGDLIQIGRYAFHFRERSRS